MVEVLKDWTREKLIMTMKISRRHSRCSRGNCGNDRLDVCAMDVEMQDLLEQMRAQLMKFTALNHEGILEQTQVVLTQREALS